MNDFENVDGQTNALEATQSQTHPDERENTQPENPVSQELNSESVHRVESTENNPNTDAVQDEVDDTVGDDEASVDDDTDDEEVEGTEDQNDNTGNPVSNTHRKRLTQAQKVDMIRELATQELGEEEICKRMELNREQFRELFFLLCQKDKKYYVIKPWPVAVKTWMLGNGIRLSQEKLESLDTNGIFKYGHRLIFKEVTEGILVTCRPRNEEDEIKWRVKQARKENTKKAEQKANEVPTGDQNMADETATTSAPDGEQLIVPPVQARESTPAEESVPPTNEILK